MFFFVMFMQSSEMPVATGSQSAAGASPGAEYSVSTGSGDEMQGLEQYQQPESTHHEDDDVNDDAIDVSDTL